MTKTKKIVLLSVLTVVGLIIYLFKKLYMKMFFTYRPNGEIMRDCDPQGCGYYGAPRGNRKHEGVDIVSLPNEIVFAPFKCKITKFGTVYSSTSNFKYIEFKGFGLLSVFKIRVFYAIPFSDELLNVMVGSVLSKGSPMGTTQNISAYHGGGMINHLHIAVRLFRKTINPTKFIKFE